MFAILFWLFTGASKGGLTSFALISSYVMSVEIVALLLLIFFARSIKNTPYVIGSLLFALCIVVPFFLVELCAQVFLNNSHLLSFDYQRLLSVSVAGLLVSVLLIRFFTLLNVLNVRNQAEAESRVLALQARIQPHFLFNSLNSIAELTVASPQDAEKAIESLSMLFRASLENQRKQHSLENELRLCREYVSLEKWRFQSKLSIEWNIAIEEPSIWQVPKLILQPLIENAIVHGVQIDGSVTISIDIRETNTDLSLMIDNVIGSKSGSSNGIALNNIRERLLVLYDDMHTFRIKNNNGIYSVIMRFPKRRQNQDYS